MHYLMLFYVKFCNKPFLGRLKMMHIIRALSIVFGFLALGEIVVYVTKIPFPASVLGLFGLFFALQLGWVKVAWLRQLTDTLMGNLSLFLVPPCVAIMNYLDVVQRDFLPIVISSVLSTCVVLYVTGKTYEWLRKRK